jgi:hypothetical protein
MAVPFIITTCEAAAGVLREGGLGDKVVAVTDRLHEGPCPVDDDIVAFFTARLRAMAEHLDPHEREARPGTYGRAWLAELTETRYAPRVEIWADPTPAAQLRLLLILHALGRERIGFDGVHIVHSNVEIGGIEPAQTTRLGKLRQPVNERQRTLAEVAWAAFRHPTPEPWAALIGQSLSALPYLGATVRRLLEELPAARGSVTRSEREMLAAIAGGEGRPFRVMAACDAKPLLDILARAQAPLAVGLAEGPFDLALHQDAHRLAAYKASQLQMTKLGRSVLDGRDDLARLIRIDRWWGGTQLTNARLWRWDGEAQRLVPPPGHRAT